MNTELATIKWCGVDLLLDARRAMIMERTAFIADPHFGKPAAFRAAGHPVPEAVTASDLQRLSAIVEDHGIDVLVVLGDLLHHRSGCDDVTFAALGAWRDRHRNLEVLQVRGNHDRKAGDPPDDLSFDCCDPPMEYGPFVLAHEPPESPEAPTLAGHLHPAVQLHSPKGSRRMRAACLWLRSKVAILPAFTRFAGTLRVQPSSGDRVFAFGSGAVVEVGGMVKGESR